MSEIKDSRILACMTSEMDGMEIAETAAELAKAFHENFSILYLTLFSSADNKQKERELAEKMGVRFMSIAGTDIASQIAEYARVCGAERIVIGISEKKKNIFVKKDRIIQRLLKLAPYLDVYLVSQEYALVYTASKKHQKLNLNSCLITLGMLGLTTLLSMLLYSIGVTETNIVTVYILSVLLISYLTDGYTYSIFASLASVLIFNYFFTEPRYTFFAYETGYPLTFAVMGISAILTSSLTIRSKKEEKVIAQKAYRTDVLLAASRNLQHSQTQNEILLDSAALISRFTGKSVLLYPLVNSRLDRPIVKKIASDDQKINEDVLQNEIPIARWTYFNASEAGAGTAISPNAMYRYLPVYGSKGILGVVGIHAGRQTKAEDMDQDLLTALLSECGTAIEREQLRENQNRLEIETQREKTRSTLLRAISHDLRTPLTSISGNSEVLLQEEEKLDEAQRHLLYQNINDDAEWLINVVENILLTTRMDNNSLTLNLQPEAVQDLIEEAADHMSHLLNGHTLKIVPQDELMMVEVEASLMIQVLSNLIDNAVKYTPQGTVITITQEKHADEVWIRIADTGPGINDEMKKNLFTMFYTAGSLRGDSRRGLGLGLSLCRTIAEAHHGRISERDNDPHGCVFTVALPLMKEVQIDE